MYLFVYSTRVCGYLWLLISNPVSVLHLRTSLVPITAHCVSCEQSDSPPKLPLLLPSTSPFPHLIAWASINFQRLHFTWSIFTFHSISEIVLWRSLWKLYSAWNYSIFFPQFFYPYSCLKRLITAAINEKRKTQSDFFFIPIVKVVEESWHHR